jgi:LEA14-like dessication related protein
MVLRIKKNILFFIAIILITFMQSCKMQDLVLGNPEGLKVDELSRKNIGLTIDLPVENPNNFGFTVRGVDMDLYINDVKMGNIKKVDRVKVKSKSNEIYPISFNIIPSELLGGAWGILRDLSGRNVELRLDGSVKVSKFILAKKIKLDEKQVVEIF